MNAGCRQMRVRLSTLPLCGAGVARSLHGRGVLFHLKSAAFRSDRRDVRLQCAGNGGAGC